MNARLLFAALMSVIAATTATIPAQDTEAPAALSPIAKDVPYADPPADRQVLDIYAPPDAKNLPVIVWIHGGGWQTGDKTSVQHKPAAFADRGFVFAAMNYRLLPHVEMGVLVRDVAKAIGWINRHIAEYGGDSTRMLIMGHSAGAQLAALLCTDERYLQNEGVAMTSIKGCVPVDGDTYDLPAMIATGETRRKLHGQPEPKFGHRAKFGTPEQHVEFSAVKHIKKGKGIPPFLILHVADHPDNAAQAYRLGAVLKEAEIKGKVFGAKNTNHTRINAELGIPGDPSSDELFKFVKEALGR